MYTGCPFYLGQNFVVALPFQIRSISPECTRVQLIIGYSQDKFLQFLMAATNPHTPCATSNYPKDTFGPPAKKTILW